MTQTLTVDFNKPMPLFPLAQCMLLPHSTIPMHIFEQRYRKMMRDVLDSHGLIAMATFKGRNWQQEYYGHPEIREHMCVGYIIRHQCLNDGRYNILLQGICRARLIEELDHEPYRMARLEPTEITPPAEPDMTDIRDQLETYLNDPVMQQLAAIGAIRNWLSREIPTSVLIDLIIQIICKDLNQRYAMLAEPDAFNRADWIADHLAQTRNTLLIANRMGPSQSDDGYNLN